MARSPEAPDPTFGRLAGIRSRCAAELARDVTGRTRAGLPGSSKTRHDHDGPRPKGSRRGVLHWTDPVGNTAAGNVDGDEAFAALTERQRLVLTLANDGYSQEEIAQALGCGRSTVANTLSTARKKLAARIDKKAS